MLGGGSAMAPGGSQTRPASQTQGLGKRSSRQPCPATPGKHLPRRRPPSPSVLTVANTRIRTSWGALKKLRFRVSWVAPSLSVCLQLR